MQRKNVQMRVSDEDVATYQAAGFVLVIPPVVVLPSSSLEPEAKPGGEPDTDSGPEDVLPIKADATEAKVTAVVAARAVEPELVAEAVVAPLGKVKPVGSEVLSNSGEVAKPGKRGRKSSGGKAPAARGGR